MYFNIYFFIYITLYIYPYFRMWEEPEDFVALFASTSTSSWVPPTSYGLFDIYNSTKFLTAEWDVKTSPVSLFTTAVYPTVRYRSTPFGMLSSVLGNLASSTEDYHSSSASSAASSFETSASSVPGFSTTTVPAVDVLVESYGEAVLTAAAVGATAAILAVLLFCFFFCYQ